MNGGRYFSSTFAHRACSAEKSQLSQYIKLAAKWSYDDESVENVQINCVMMMHINRYITLVRFVFIA